MNFCVTLVTCNNRNTTEKVIKSFIDNTNIDVEKLNFYVYVQGCTDYYISSLKSIEHPNIKFHWIIKEKNSGLTLAMNELNDLSKNYKYTMFLEDDWICIPDENKNWLKDSLQFLDSNTDVSTLFLRKWSGEKEKWKYGWTRTVEYFIHTNPNNYNYAKKMKGSHKVKINHTKFQHIPEYLYSNNPNIHRNEDYYRVGIFPFIPHDDIKEQLGEWTDANSSSDKITKCWGYSEAYSMEKHLKLKCYYVDNGIFGHYEDWVQHMDLYINFYYECMNDYGRASHIYDKNKYLFIQIPKTGSTFLWHCFYTGNYPQYLNEKIYRHEGIGSWILELGDKLPKTFTIIRNPYDRLLSYYLHCTPNIPFLDFLKLKVKEKNPHLWQHKHICDKNDKILVDHVFKYEDGMENIMSNIIKCGISPIRTNDPNKQLNSGPKKLSKEEKMEYFNNETIEYISDIFKKDFEIFEYSTVI